MERIVDEMSKVRGDVERRMRRRISEIIDECQGFSYLGQMFTFDYDDELSRKINGILISLSDDIMGDIESRAKVAISEAEEEEDEDVILAHIKREINGEDLTARLDRHNSALRYFLEGWIAIGFAESISRQSLLSDIFSYMDNPFASPRWQSAFGKGYASSAIRSYGYTFGKGNQRNVLNALSLAGEYAINESFQYGRIMRYGKDGAIGYRTHRGSTFDCPYCDELTRTVHPLTDIVLPAHPRCVCYSTPVYRTEGTDEHTRTPLTEEQKAHIKELSKNAAAKLRGIKVSNVIEFRFSRAGIDEFLNQPHNMYFEKNESVMYLDTILSEAQYLGINPKYKRKNVKYSHIYEGRLLGSPIWYVVREYNDGNILFHSCSDSPIIATGLIQK